MQKLLHSKILGRGNPLLILHGFLGSGDNWITLAKKFAEHFEVHLIDLRNHGRSFHADAMSFDLMSEDVYYYCKTKELKEISLLGHSMGGKVGMHLAVIYPQLVTKLIVADIAPKAYKPGHDNLIKALNAVDFSIHTSRESIANIVAKHIDSEPVRLFLSKGVYRAGKNAFAFRFNFPILKKCYPSITKALPQHFRYEGDVLFLKGEYSDYILGSDVDLIEEHFPNAEIIALANAGHWLHAENPKEFFKYVMVFLL